MYDFETLNITSVYLGVSESNFYAMVMKLSHNMQFIRNLSSEKIFMEL